MIPGNVGEQWEVPVEMKEFYVWDPDKIQEKIYFRLDSHTHVSTKGLNADSLINTLNSTLLKMSAMSLVWIIIDFSTSKAKSLL